MIISVDFDGTLATGNYPYISMLAPNRELISRLKELRQTMDVTIKVVTARGAKDGLSQYQRFEKYERQIIDWLNKYEVSFDELSFTKEYANLYIDDQTISQYSPFTGITSTFTGNRVILTETAAIKNATSAPMELEWYKRAELLDLLSAKTPDVLFCNSDCLITSRIHGHEPPKTAQVFIEILKEFRSLPPFDSCRYYHTYLDNLPRDIPNMSEETRAILEGMEDAGHLPTFFHGDLSTTNVLCTDDGPYLIDPNVKHIFGSYLTDAGKAVFSLIAYEANYPEAEKIAAYFGAKVWRFAVAEGLRVCKYAPKYVSIVNNIADVTT